MEYPSGVENPGVVGDRLMTKAICAEDLENASRKRVLPDLNAAVELRIDHILTYGKESGRS